MEGWRRSPPSRVDRDRSALESTRIFRSIFFRLTFIEGTREPSEGVRAFEAAQNLKCDLSGLPNTATDGWMPLEECEETESAHREMFNEMLQAVLSNQEVDDDESVRNEAILRSIWSFDI